MATPANTTGPTEAELIARVLRGERQLFHDLVRPHETAVYLTAFSILRNHADAEEVAQETMLKALTALEQLRSPEKFRPWLLRIAMNQARLRIRDDRAAILEPLEGDPGHGEEFMPRDFADWRPDPSKLLERQQTRTAITRALQELPPIYREVFLLRDVQHLSVADCAELTGVTETVVKVRLHRARLQMREKLAPLFRRSWLGRLRVLPRRRKT